MGLRTGRNWLSWLPVALVALFPAVEAIREAVAGGPVLLDGDIALIELSTRRAYHLDQLVGAYSRYNFHEPGPVMFYLMAPILRVFEPWGPGLNVAAISINGVALVALVAIIRKWAGPLATLWAVAACGVFELSTWVNTFRQAWNPDLIVVAMGLFGLLVAGAAAGRRGAWLWAALVGSYAVQTHLATAIPVGVLLLLSGGARLVQIRRSRTDRTLRTGWVVRLYAPAALLVLIWVPPVVELFRDQPDNIRALITFFRAAPPVPPFSAAARTWANDVAIVPFGYTSGTRIHHPGWELVVEAVGLVAMCLATVWLSRRRGERLGPRLVAVAFVLAVSGLLALWRAPGPSYAYFGTWLAAVPLLALLGFGAALFGPAAPRWASGRVVLDRGVRGAMAVVAVGVTVAVLHADLALPPVKDVVTPNEVAGYQMAVRIQAAGVRPHSTVAIDIGTQTSWPMVSSLVLDLDRDGVASTVGPSYWTLLFGHERRPGRPTVASFTVYSDADFLARHLPVSSALLASEGWVLVEAPA